MNIYSCVLLEFDERVMNGDDFVLYLGFLSYTWALSLGGWWGLEGKLTTDCKRNKYIDII